MSRYRRPETAADAGGDPRTAGSHGTDAGACTEIVLRDAECGQAARRHQCFRAIALYRCPDAADLSAGGIRILTRRGVDPRDGAAEDTPLLEFSARRSVF